MSKMERFFTGITVIWVVIFSVFGERIFVNVATGGRGVLQIFTILTPVLAMMILFFWKGSSLGFLKKKRFVLFFLPYILLTIFLPFMGVIFNDYPVRVTFSAMIGINALAFASIGYWLSIRKNLNGSSITKYLEKSLIIAISLQFLYSLGQYAYKSGYLGPIWQPFYEWDLTSTTKAGLEMVYSRSSGLFLNPNILGFWSVLSFWVVTFMISSKKWRFILQLMCLSILLFSQSRGAIGALLVSYVFITTVDFAKTFTITHPLRTLAKIPLLMLAGYFLLSSSKDSTFVERMISALNIFSQGSTADANFNTRTIVWNKAFEWFPNYPLGTFGSPEFLFGSFVDNDWVRIFLQGGFIYVASLLLLIIGSLILMNHSRTGKFVAVSAVVIGVCGITQTPLAYIPMALFWFFVGVVAGEIREAKSVPSSYKDSKAA